MDTINNALLFVLCLSSYACDIIILLLFWKTIYIYNSISVSMDTEILLQLSLIIQRNSVPLWYNRAKEDAS